MRLLAGRGLGAALRVLVRALLAVRRLVLFLAFHQGMCVRLHSSDGLPPAAARRVLSGPRHCVVEGQETGSFLLKLLHPFGLKGRRVTCGSLMAQWSTEVDSVRCLGIFDLARVSLAA